MKKLHALFERSVAPGAAGWIVDVASARAAHPALQIRLWKRLCAMAIGAPVRLEQTHLEALLQLTARRAGAGKLSLPGLLAWRSYGQILLCPDAALVRAAGETTLAVPGEAEIPSGSPGSLPRLRAERVECTGPAYNENEEVDRGRVGGNGFAAPPGAGSGSACGDGRGVGPMDALVLRGWCSGDWIRPLGRTAACKLHELFEEQRVPAWERLAWPVVLWRGRIVWTRRFGFDGDADCCAGGGALHFTEVTTGAKMSCLAHPGRLIK